MKNQIGLKNPAKPFPLNTDVGVLKWRFQVRQTYRAMLTFSSFLAGDSKLLLFYSFQTQDEANLPVSINCWPSDNGQGGCDVNIEYELEQEHLELNDVVVSIPIP